MFHRQPRQRFSVGREGGVGVVAHHALGQVARCPGGDVVEVEIGVCRDGILLSGFLARGVDEALAVGRPCERLHSAEGLHGRFVGLVFHYVDDVDDLAAGEVGEEGVGHLGDPFVPVLIHKVVDDAARCLRKVGIGVGGCAAVFDVADHDNALRVGAENEARDSFLDMAHLNAVLAVGVHDPELADLVFVGIDEGDAASAVDPAGIAFAGGGAGEADRAACFLEVDEIEVVVALVLLDALVRDTVEHFRAVGRYLRVADAAEGLQSLDVEDSVGGSCEGRLVDQGGVVSCRGAEGCGNHCRCHC